MPTYFYIAMIYDKLCIAGKYLTQQDAENNLGIFPKDSKVFSSECPDIGDKSVVNQARQIMYQKTTTLETT